MIYHSRRTFAAQIDKWMKRKISIMSVVLLAALASCSKEKEKQMTQSEINAKVDSIIGTRIDELNQQAMEDLDRRKSIEVKAKTDSIVDAYISAQNPAAKPEGSEQAPPPPAAEK